MIILGMIVCGAGGVKVGVSGVMTIFGGDISGVGGVIIILGMIVSGAGGVITILGMIMGGVNFSCYNGWSNCIVHTKLRC